MSPQNSSRSASIRLLIQEFIAKRRDDKLEKLTDDDPKRPELSAQFQPAVWLADAARRVGQIQAVTHSLKPIHPDAKGSSLFCEPGQLTALDVVGTHSLGVQFEADVVGNAAVLDVYKLLKLRHEGKSLVALAVAGDADLAAALSPDETLAQQWLQAFAGLALARGRPSSHTNAKQLYWLTGTDAHDERAFHLLAPLYPTSLVHRVYLQLQDDRFSDEAKASRAARKAGEPHGRPVREYRNLAVQKLGGSNKQNIGQLNVVRNGTNCLLASLPPVWRSADVRPLLGVENLFRVFGGRTEVKQLVQALRHFLESDPAPNQATRRQVQEWLEQMIDELVFFQAELSALNPGWSLAPECKLPMAQRVWLDPEAEREGGPRMAIDDGADAVFDDFANWINQQLRESLPVGDAEFIRWRKLARNEFAALAREAA